MLEDSFEIQVSLALNALACALCHQNNIDGDKLIRDFAKIAQQMSPTNEKKLGVIKTLLDAMGVAMNAVRQPNDIAR